MRSNDGVIRAARGRSTVVIYLWIKAAHITSLIVWMGTQLCLPPLLSWLGGMPSAVRDRIAARLRQRVRAVASVAMLGTWGFGLALLTLGGWASDAWLQAKLVLVLALSATHGLWSAQLRRLAEEPGYRAPDWFGRAAIAQLAAVALIATLVTVKPG